MKLHHKSRKYLRIKKGACTPTKQSGDYKPSLSLSSENLHFVKCASLSIPIPSGHLYSASSFKEKYPRSSSIHTTKPKQMFPLSSYSVAYHVRREHGSKYLHTMIGSCASLWSQILRKSSKISLVKNLCFLMVGKIKK